MVRRTDTRQRMLASAAALFHTQGYHATGLNQLVAAGGAPKGSLYFHFPGGKEQLAAEALRVSSGELRDVLTAIVAAAPDAATAIGNVVDALTETLAASGFQQGCPLATVALDAAAESEQIRAACVDGFASWHEVLAGYFTTKGLEPVRADALTTIVLSCLEGGLLLARTQQDVTPLRAIGDHLRATVGRELP